jgi:hypothetical protein
LGNGLIDNGLHKQELPMPHQSRSSLPAKPHLTLQIGITGHRPAGLVAAEPAVLQQRLEKILHNLKQAYLDIADGATAQSLFAASGPLPPRLLSPLAEGADQLAARSALVNGYELHCPLPFTRQTYATDFHDAPPSLEAYQTLLGKAKRILELDGCRSQPETAYREVGYFVLRHSDILLAVWNGVEDDHSPGTAGMVKAALEQGKPVIWIDAVAPHHVQIYHQQLHGGQWQPGGLDTDSLRAMLEKILLPQIATETASDEPAFWRRWKNANLAQNVYFSHHQPRRGRLSTVYRALFNLLGRGRLLGWIGNPYPVIAHQQWLTIFNASQPELKLDSQTARHFEHADALASYYADQYRGTFVISYWLGALAVAFALLGAPFAYAGEQGIGFAVAELLTIAGIIFLIMRGGVMALHTRWLDFRLVAERLRQHLFLAPVCAVSQWSLPAYHSHGDSSLQWIDWLLRSIIRAEGMPTASFGPEYRLCYASFLQKMIDDQYLYHRNNADRNKNIAEVLHGFKWLLLSAIIFACLLHIAGHSELLASHLHRHINQERLAYFTTLIAAIFPACGAAVAGILGQGEFERIAQRSEGMAVHLAKLSRELKADHNGSISELSRHAQEAIEIMSQELFDWRVIFRAKPLEQHA